MLRGTRKEKIYSILGYWYGVKYQFAYFLHKHYYIKFIGKREIKLRLWNKYSFYVRMFSRDLDFFESILVGEPIDGIYVGEYDMECAEDKFKDILDLGANIGLFAVLYAVRYPDKKIIAVEPEVENFRILRKNTRKFDNVVCINKGVWYRKSYCKVYPGRVLVQPSNTYSEGSFYIGECAKGDSNAIEGVSIAGIIKKYKLEKCLIKMDIEGAEQDIFEKGSLDWLRECSVLVMETHEWLFNNHMDEMIKGKMLEQGYLLSCLGENKIFMK